MQKSAISWTNLTWNPVLGCSKVSDGCKFCYAMTLSEKRGWTPKPWTVQNEAENVILKPHKLHEPYKIAEPSRVFVNSMSDAHHRAIPDWYRAALWCVMLDLPQHIYQVLTKRGEALPDWEERFVAALQSAEFAAFRDQVKDKRVKAALAKPWTTPWADHIWQGVSVEDHRVLHRLDQLRACGAKVKFVSAEPLLGDWGADANVRGIDWIIVGGESGFHLKPDDPRWMQMTWARQIKRLCVDAGVAFFFKQDSGYKTELRPWVVEEDGSKWRWHQYPGDLTPPVPLDDKGEPIAGEALVMAYDRQAIEDWDWGSAPREATILDDPPPPPTVETRQRASLFRRDPAPVAHPVTTERASSLMLSSEERRILETALTAWNTTHANGWVHTHNVAANTPELEQMVARGLLEAATWHWYTDGAGGGRPYHVYRVTQEGVDALSLEALPDWTPGSAIRCEPLTDGGAPIPGTFLSWSKPHGWAKVVLVDEHGDMRLDVHHRALTTVEPEASPSHTNARALEGEAFVIDQEVEHRGTKERGVIRHIAGGRVHVQVYGSDGDLIDIRQPNGAPVLAEWLAIHVTPAEPCWWIADIPPLFPTHNDAHPLTVETLVFRNDHLPAQQRARCRGPYPNQAEALAQRQRSWVQTGDPNAVGLLLPVTLGVKAYAEAVRKENAARAEVVHLTDILADNIADGAPSVERDIPLDKALHQLALFPV